MTPTPSEGADERLDLSGATYLKNFVWYYDGPVVALYELNGKKYIGIWVATTDLNVDTWLVGEIDDATLSAFSANQVSLREVLECSPALYKGETSCLYLVEPMRQVSWADVPEEQKPHPDSYLQLLKL